MIVRRTLDLGLILDILSDKEIFDSISEDGATFNDLNLDVLKHYWLEIEVNEYVIGVVQFKPMFSKCYDAHIHILPEFRREYSKEAGSKILEWCDANIPNSLIYTNVPEFCKNVIAFLESFDFEWSGKLSGAWLKNGINNDMIIYTKRVK